MYIAKCVLCMLTHFVVVPLSAESFLGRLRDPNMEFARSAPSSMGAIIAIAAVLERGGSDRTCTTAVDPARVGLET